MELKIEKKKCIAKITTANTKTSLSIEVNGTSFIADVTGWVLPSSSERREWHNLMRVLTNALETSINYHRANNETALLDQTVKNLGILKEFRSTHLI